MQKSRLVLFSGNDFYYFYFFIMKLEIFRTVQTWRKANWLKISKDYLKNSSSEVIFSFPIFLRSTSKFPENGQKISQNTFFFNVQKYSKNTPKILLLYSTPTLLRAKIQKILYSTRVLFENTLFYLSTRVKYSA